MLPLVPGAVAVTVNAAVPPFAAIPPAGIVSVHVSNAPLALGKPPQFTALVPLPAATAVAMTPTGNWSCTVRLVPVAVCPLFVTVTVYVSVPFTSANAGPLFAIVTFAGVFTVVTALPQLVAGVQAGPGVGGVGPPLGSTDA